MRADAGEARPVWGSICCRAFICRDEGLLGFDMGMPRCEARELVLGTLAGRWVCAGSSPMRECPSGAGLPEEPPGFVYSVALSAFGGHSQTRGGTLKGVGEERWWENHRGNGSSLCVGSAGAMG